MVMVSSDIVQTVIGLFVCVLYWMLCSHTRPFEASQDYYLTIGSQFILFVSMLIGLVSKVKADVKDQALIGVTLIVLNVVVPLATVVVIAMEACYAYRNVTSKNRIEPLQHGDGLD